MKLRDPKLNPYLTHSNRMRLAEVNASNGKLAIERWSYPPGISIIILNLNKPELICPLLNELVTTRATLAKENLDLHVFVGDTGSTDLHVLREYDRLADQVQVVRNLKYQFSENNTEIFNDFVRTDICLFMNNDIVFQDGSSVDIIRKIHTRFRQNENTGIIGASLLYQNGSIQHLGIDFIRDSNLRGLCYHPLHQHRMDELSTLDGRFWNVPAVTGAFLAIRSELFRNIGGFDSKYAAECQDVDLCLKGVRQGFQVDLLLSSKIVHLENATRPKGSENWEDRQRFVRRWTAFIEAIV